MPIPRRRTGETEDSFISRCMGDDVMKAEYPNQGRRSAVCHQQLEANMLINQVKVLINNYRVRVRQLHGEDHLIAPVVLLTEGVHCGSGGCLYYPANELAKYPMAWNGSPLPVQHPADNGQPISANSPVIFDGQSVGFLFNVIYHNGKLKGEIWVNVKKAGEISPEVLQTLRDSKPLEVSTGLFSDSINESGRWQGEEYDYTVVNIRPDHLALLPGEVGACSVDDGCGVRSNKKDKQEDKMNKVKPIAFDEFRNAFDELTEKGQKQVNDYLTNQLSHFDIRQKLQAQVDTLDRPDKIHYVVDVFDNFFIYKQENSMGGTRSSVLYKQNYNINSEDELNLGEEVSEVREETNYVTLAATNQSKGGSHMDKKTGDEKCCPEKVQALIDNEATKYVPEDKEWLEGLTENQLDKMIPEVKEPEKKKDVTDNKDKTDVTDNKDKKTDKKENEVKENKPTFKELLDNAEPEDREAIQEGKRLYAEKKTALVNAILGNKRNKFTEEELNKKEFGELQKIAELSQTVVNYDGNGGSSLTEDGAGKIEVLEAPEVTFGDKNKKS